jgi:chromosome segregation ATPase
MQDKKLIFTVEAVMVALFLSAVTFFFQIRETSAVLEVYQNQLKRTGTFLEHTLILLRRYSENNKGLTISSSRLGHINRKLISDNRLLKDRNRTLSSKVVATGEENFLLKEQNQGLNAAMVKTVVVGNSLMPVREKITKINAMADELDPHASDRKKLLDNLKKLYTELNALDLQLAKVLRDDGLYKDKVAVVKKELAASVVTTEKLQQDLAGVAKEKNDFLAQIEQYRKESQDLAARLEELNKQKAGLEANIAKTNKELESRAGAGAAMEEKVKQLTAQYDQAKQEHEAAVQDADKSSRQVGFFRDELAGRDKLEAGLNQKLEGQLQDIARLQGEIVRYKLESRKIASDSQQKEGVLKSLRQEINQIADVNQKVKGYLEQAAGALGSAKQAPAVGDKEVQVKIDSVESDKEPPGKQQ